MPFIVKTKRPYGRWVTGQQEWRVSRRACATLEEAQEAAEQALHDATTRSPEIHGWLEPLYEIRDLPELGGTVGPLPDGTVIEVEPIGWETIETAVTDLPPMSVSHGDRVSLLDAFNARQS